MSTRILEVSALTQGDDKLKKYITSAKASETFQGICPGDVIKVVDIDSCELLATGIMCTSDRKVPCSDCMFSIATKPFIVGACDYVPCHSMSMIPMKPEDVMEKL